MKSDYRKTNSRWVQTYTGKRFCPYQLSIDSICIEDIAHALSMVCRFNGHCNTFYSVAEHSVIASKKLETFSKELARWGLLHDAAEAYISDIPSPFKFPVIQITEQKIMEVIQARFGLPKLSTNEQKKLDEVDLRLLATEKRDLMEVDLEWGCLKGIKPYKEVITNRGNHVIVEQIFLSRYRELFDVH